MANAKPTDDLKVFISSRESKCGECGEELGQHAWEHGPPGEPT